MFYSSYKVKWRISKLILKACTISLNALNYIFTFQVALMFFVSFMKYREYQTINHKWYNVNHFVNESIYSYSRN